MIYCTICRRHEPSNGVSCGSCGTPLERCEGKPPKRRTRCTRCTGSGVERTSDGRLRCVACGHEEHGFAFKGLPASATARIRDSREGGRHQRRVAH